MSTEKILIERCKNWIRALFAENIPSTGGIYTKLFWKLAEESGLYIKDTYGSPMTKALTELTTYEMITNDNGDFLYGVFKLKKEV